jgi:hypothetical protein
MDTPGLVEYLPGIPKRYGDTKHEICDNDGIPAHPGLYLLSSIIERKNRGKKS